MFVPRDALELAFKYIDLFYIDIKILDVMMCKKILGGSIKQYLSNLDRLFTSRKQVVFRVPVIGEFTDNESNREAVIDLLLQYKPLKVELIKEHNLGESKYASLGKRCLVLNKVADELMEKYRLKIESATKIHVEVCKA